MSDKENKLDWGTDTENLVEPEHDIQDWEWSVAPSNDKGESDLLQTRIPPDMGRAIDETIMETKMTGIPMKTRSDFARVAAMRLLDQLRKFLNSQDENITHWLVLERYAQQEAHKLQMLERVVTTIQNVMKGLNVLVISEDWNELNTRLTDYLTPITNMRVSNEYLANLYVKELFEFPNFQSILKDLKNNRGSISDVIKETERIYKSK